MNTILIHDDGGACQGTPLDENGKCPACGLTPDMQSTALVNGGVDLTEYLLPEYRDVCSRCGGTMLKGARVCAKCFLNDDPLDAEFVG